MALWDDFVQGLRKKVITSVQGYDYDQDWGEVAGRFLTGSGEYTDEWVADMQKRIYPSALKSGQMKPWKEGDLEKGRRPPQRIAERIDQMLLSAEEPQMYDTMKDSAYVPTKGAEEGEKFYTWTDKSQMNKIFESFKDELEGWDEGKSYNVGYRGDVDKGDAKYVNPGVVGLGRYQVGKGSDDFGKYMFVYDKWDIDPGIGGDVGKSIAQSIMPGFEVYDRHYYDFDKPKPLNIRRADDIDKVFNYVSKAG